METTTQIKRAHELSTVLSKSIFIGSDTIVISYHNALAEICNAPGGGGATKLSHSNSLIFTASVTQCESILPNSQFTFPFQN